ncbi:MAG: PKD domain-containing protein, partial [Methanospirillaceae archaeon]|nr:PKD domain-containing protein [Methanospirillaceae archaeon]
ITLEVTGPGGTDTASGEVMVSAPVVPPKASFITDRSFGEAPLMVAFADMSDGTIRSWNWSFGDGAVSSLQNPVHMYQNPGTYTITLEVTGSGGSDTVSGEVMVSAPVVPLKASFITDHSFGEAPLMVAFADMSDGTIRSWNWSFGDGEISSLQNPVHSYQTPGIFTVNLTVDDGSGSDAATGIITVKEVMQKETSSPLPIPGSLSEISGKSEDRRDTGDQSALETKTEPPSQTPVQASFTADRRSGYVPLPVVFTDTSQGDVRQWHWDFGDGDDAYHQHPGHTYKDPGIYDVTLVVSGNYSYSSRKHEGYIVVSQQQGQDEPEMFQPLLVQEQNPETYPEEDVPGDIRASFTQNRSLGKVPFTVIFTDTSTGSVECRYWFFGDDSSSSERNPMHTYLKKGTYYVTLSLCDDGSVTTKTANSVVYAV